jgi:preprotein translocase subunit YajC
MWVSTAFNMKITVLWEGLFFLLMFRTAQRRNTRMTEELEGVEKKHEKTSVRIAGILNKIRTKHLQNIKLGRYRYSRM